MSTHWDTAGETSGQAPAHTHPSPVVPGRLLGYGGLVPFFVLAALAVWGQALVPAAAQALLGWGAVILSFVGAVHWGWSIRNDDGVQRTGSAGAPAVVIVLSVLPATVAWFALVLPVRLGATLLIGGFVGFYLYERLTRRSVRLPAWYLSMRTRLTVGACLALAVGTLLGPAA